MPNSGSPLNITLAAEEQKLLACIHCGLCLEACPTYVLTGDENDGPRGRIYLMRAVEEGRLSTNSPSFERHINRCLGCRACEQVCPAGVEYGQLLEAGRAELFRSNTSQTFKGRLLRFVLRHVWSHPGRLKFAFALARIVRGSGLARLLLRSRIAKLVSSQLEFSLALLESSSRQPIVAQRHRNTLETDSVKPPALLFEGCVGQGLFARVNQATVRVLATNRFAVQVPREQVCCGALHAHAGDLEGARRLAKMNIHAFRGPDDTSVVTNAGGCGAMLLTYGHLLANDEELAEEAQAFSSRVRDVSQLLTKVDLKIGAATSAGLITYDASCHLLYGQHAGEAQLEMLQAIPDLNFRPLEGSERCCGGAGIYNLLEPDMSSEVLREKLAHIKDTGAEILATGNPGCQMQIGAGALLSGLPLQVCHPVELLDESYRRAGLYD